MTDMLEQRLQRHITQARELYARYGETMGRDAGLSKLLSRYRDALCRSGEHMRRMGVVDACTACAARGPGSCCFTGIEDGYDWALLLINLLLGCSLPKTREVSESCFFVGAQGCKLMGRYYFCVHYLCPELQRRLGPARTQELLRTIGEELSAGWELEQALRHWINKASFFAHP